MALFSAIWYLILISSIFIQYEYVIGKTSDSLNTNPYAIGDLMIGNLMSLDRIFDPVTQTYIPIYSEAMKRVEAMIYAVQNINKDKKLLPNITLGYDMRDYCHTTRIALTQAFQFINKLTASSCQNQNYEGNQHHSNHSVDHTYDYNRVIAIIGCERSQTSLAVATLLGDFNVPLISHFATNQLLSDRVRFNTFFRTVPSDVNQALVILKLIQHFGWSYIGVIAVGDGYGETLASTFVSMATKVGICVPIYRLLSLHKVYTESKDIIKCLSRDENIRVIILFCNSFEAITILNEAENQNLTGRIFLGSDGWLTNELVVKGVNKTMLTGTLGIAFATDNNAAFESYLSHVNLCHQDDNPWLVEYQAFLQRQNPYSTNCNLTNTSSNVTFSPKLDASVSQHVIDSIYAIAHALHKLLNCNNEYCPYQDFRSLERAKLVALLHNVSFTAGSNKQFRFDQNGDGKSPYIIVNGQIDPTSGQLIYVKVGDVDSNMQLHLRDELILWGKMSSRYVPVSRCSQNCPPGTYRHFIDVGTCCWNCSLCPLNYYSNYTNLPSCMFCGIGYEANQNHSECVEIGVTNLKWNDPLVISATVFLFISVSITLIIWIIICKFRHTPIIKAANFPLTNLFFTGIMCVYSIVPLLLIPQSSATCTIVFVMFTMSSAFLLVVLIARTHILVKVFAKKSSQVDKKRTLYSKLYYLLLIIAMLTPLIITLGVIARIDPLYIDRYVTSHNVVYAYCTSKHKAGLAATSVVLLLLNLICVYYAFKVRKLPGIFNETRNIFFTSMTMCIILSAVISACLLDRGRYETGIKVFGMIAYGLATGLCIFAPRIYIIYFNYEQNTKESAILEITKYSFAESISQSLNLKRKNQFGNKISNSDN